jgi:hypothetical protein
MRKQSAPPSTYTSACHEVGGEAALRRLIGRAAMVGSARLSLAPGTVPSWMLVSRRSRGFWGAPVRVARQVARVACRSHRLPFVPIGPSDRARTSPPVASVAWRDWCLLADAVSIPPWPAVARGHGPRFRRPVDPRCLASASCSWWRWLGCARRFNVTLELATPGHVVLAWVLF